MIRAQLVFDLPHRTALGAEDFLVSQCNRLAVEMVDAWPDWPQGIQLLVGPPKSGKTHLVRVWQARSGAVALSPDAASLTALDTLEAPALVVEDADRAGYDDQTLFHIINTARERNIPMLITARKPPARWDVSLPDLLSRLNALPLVEIGVPDDALLKTVMLKHFADRQLDVEPKVLDYLALHVERSLEGAARAVAAVDKVALATGRKISRQLAAEALRSDPSAG
ncbi:DnaA/Hda family protein [Methyloligella sp. 2.7D]|uniref:DnaA ATPase domain-containing protein n=1 Tax=unclassified Methyloligella TaxID=2625955 RepID=UPI001FF050C6|nr:DnaA/Hda family protein [Methyloligella sp. GL2]